MLFIFKNFIDLTDKGRERERNISLLFHLLVHLLIFCWLSLVDALTGDQTYNLGILG